MARAQGAETVDFEVEDPVQAILNLTDGIGVDRASDAVGVDAVHADHGPAAAQDAEAARQFDQEKATVAPDADPRGGNWEPGDAPSQALRWAVQALAKAGTLAVIGVYRPADTTFPIGEAMNKNLTVNMGNCNHRRYLPRLVELVRTGAVDPTAILTTTEPLTAAVEAYEAFDSRSPGWIKVQLHPQSGV